MALVGVANSKPAAELSILHAYNTSSDAENWHGPTQYNIMLSDDHIDCAQTEWDHPRPKLMHGTQELFWRSIRDEYDGPRRDLQFSHVISWEVISYMVQQFHEACQQQLQQNQPCTQQREQMENFINQLFEIDEEAVMPTAWDSSNGEPHSYVFHMTHLENQRFRIGRSRLINGLDINEIVQDDAGRYCMESLTDENWLDDCLKCLNSAPANIKIGWSTRDGNIGSAFDFMGWSNSNGHLFTTNKENNLLFYYPSLAPQNGCPNPLGYLSSTANRGTVLHANCQYNVFYDNNEIQAK